MRNLICRIIRRFYLLFYVKKIIKDLSERKGQCNRCGSCCAGCPALVRLRSGKTRCVIYKLRPYDCRIGPLRIDITRDLNANCGYYYDKK